MDDVDYDSDGVRRPYIDPVGQRLRLLEEQVRATARVVNYLLATQQQPQQPNQQQPVVPIQLPPPFAVQQLVQLGRMLPDLVESDDEDDDNFLTNRDMMAGPMWLPPPPLNFPDLVDSDNDDEDDQDKNVADKNVAHVVPIVID
jgi:hypothetical protein